MFSRRDPLLKKSISAVLVLSLSLCLLVTIAVYQLNINKDLNDFDLIYNDGQYFGILADIHLDLNQNLTACRNSDSLEGEFLNHFPSKFGFKHCDSSLDHVNLTLRDLKKTELDTDTLKFIIIVGDMIGHWTKGLDDSKKAADALKNLIDSYFPNLPVYFTLGNHDLTVETTESAYIPHDINEWYKIVWNIFSPQMYFENENNFRSASADFLGYGFYLAKHSQSLWIASLNTNVFYTSLNGSDADADIQLNWLSETLSAARSESASVIIIGHVPTGIGILDVNSWTSNQSMPWRKNQTVKYNKIVSQYPDVVKMSLFAHHHSDSWFSKETSEGSYISHMILPPVSTVSAGHPSFTIGVVNDGWDLLDMLFYQCPTEYFTRLDKTPTYQFLYSFKDQNFHIEEKYSPVNGSNLQKLTHRIIDLDDGLDKFNKMLLYSYQLRYQTSISPYQMFCIFTENLSLDLESCMQKYLYS